jgi:glycosyltransferase involved in cell wall biosynthesis
LNNSAKGNCNQRIAIITRLDEPGGVQSVVLSLIKGLNEEGIIPDIIWDKQPSPVLLEEKGVLAGYLPVRQRIPSHLIFHFPATFRYLLRAANVFSTEHIPQPYDFYYIFFNGFLVKDGTPHVRYLSGPPLVPQLEKTSPGLRGMPIRFFRWLYKIGLRKRFPAYEFHLDSTYVINSQYTADLFEEAHGVRLPVVHPPIDLSGRYFSEADLPHRDTFTFFSRFVDYKRPEMVLELAKRYPDRRFVLMGGVRAQSRPLFDSIVKIAQIENLNNVEFFDNPSSEKVREELARTLYYIFPAVNEHFGMATAEAIGSGAIPYVHDSGGQREIVPDTRLRFRDAEFFTKFEQLLLLSDEERNFIRNKLRNNVENFSEKVFKNKMVKMINLSPTKPLESERKNEFQAAAD